MLNSISADAYSIFFHKVCPFIHSCIQNEPKIQRDDLVNPFWIVDKDLKKGLVRYLDNSETNFWQKLIEKYLYPLNQDKVCVELSNLAIEFKNSLSIPNFNCYVVFNLQQHELKMKQDLRTLRNNAAFLFFMLNFLWLFIIFLLQVVQDQLKVWKLDVNPYVLITV